MLRRALPFILLLSVFAIPFIPVVAAHADTTPRSHRTADPTGVAGGWDSWRVPRADLRKDHQG